MLLLACFHSTKKEGTELSKWNVYGIGFISSFFMLLASPLAK